MDERKIFAVSQAIFQWVALLGCGILMALDHGWHVGVAVGLAIFAVMPVAK